MQTQAQATGGGGATWQVDLQPKGSGDRDDSLRVQVEVEWPGDALALAAALLADALHVTTPEIVEARRRLASLASLLGEAAVRSLAGGLVDPASGAPFVYREGMFSAPLASHRACQVSPGTEANQVSILITPRCRPARVVTAASASTEQFSRASTSSAEAAVCGHQSFRSEFGMNGG